MCHIKKIKKSIKIVCIENIRYFWTKISDIYRWCISTIYIKPTLVLAFLRSSDSCRRIVVLGLPVSHLPCSTNTNGEYSGWQSSSKPAFWKAASAWADMWAGVLSWFQVTSVCFLNWKNSWKDTNFLTTRTLSARHMAGWKTKNNNSSTAESELWRNAGPSAFQLQENMLKSDKIWYAYLVVNCVRLRTFWMPLVLVVLQKSCMVKIMKQTNCVYILVKCTVCFGDDRDIRSTCCRSSAYKYLISALRHSPLLATSLMSQALKSGCWSRFATLFIFTQLYITLLPFVFIPTRCYCFQKFNYTTRIQFPLPDTYFGM